MRSTFAIQNAGASDYIVLSSLYLNEEQIRLVFRSKPNKKALPSPYFFASACIPCWTQALGPAALASNSSSLNLAISKALCSEGTWRPFSKPGRSSSLNNHAFKWGNSSMLTPAHSVCESSCISNSAAKRYSIGINTYWPTRPSPTKQYQRW